MKELLEQADVLLQSCYNFIVELPEVALRNEMYDEMESLAGQIRRFRDKLKEAQNG